MKKKFIYFLIGALLTGLVIVMFQVTQASPARPNPGHGTSQIEGDADLNMNSNKIINLTDPTSDQDAATKGYIESFDLSSLDLDAKSLRTWSEIARIQTSPVAGCVTSWNWTLSCNQICALVGGTCYGGCSNANCEGYCATGTWCTAVTGSARLGCKCGEGTHTLLSPVYY